MALSKIDARSETVTSDGLQIFEFPPTDGTYESTTTREYLTLNPINTSPHNFKIHSTSSFLFLMKCFLVTTMRIRKMLPNSREWVDITDADNVTTIQMIGATFIRNIRILANNQEISESNGLQPFKSIFETVLSYPEGAKKSHLSSVGFCQPSERKALFAKSKTVQFITKINADLFNQPHPLVPHVEVDIEITPSDNDFMLITPPPTQDADGNLLPATQYKLEILDMRLYVKSRELMPSLNLAFNNKHEKSPAIYPLRKTDIKSLYISADRTEFNALLCPGKGPRRVTVVVVANDNFKGAIHTDPFVFRPHGVRDITIHSQGRQFPNVPYNLDWKNGQYIRAYHDLLEATGIANTTADNGITRTMFADDHTFFSFNLTNTQEDEPTFELVKTGGTSISINFREKVPEGGLVLIAYMEYDSLLLIDKNRTITTDTSV